LEEDRQRRDVLRSRDSWTSIADFTNNNRLLCFSKQTYRLVSFSKSARDFRFEPFNLRLTSSSFLDASKKTAVAEEF
jgi:hypothetical protein